jgi:acyl-CoA thioesterase-2
MSLSEPFQGLLRRLDLEAIGTDVFTGRSGRGEGTLFGGMVAAQAAVAAGRTVEGRTLHSLHAYFLRPGEHRAEIRYRVSRLREGRTFSTRAVSAEQSNEIIFHCVVDFSRPEEGLAHQEVTMPAAPPPDSLPEWEDVRGEALGPEGDRRRDGPIEVRVCDPDSTDPEVKLPARRRVWLRARGRLPEDPLVRAAALVFASDRTLLRTAGRPHGITWRPSVGASLDHAVWIHRLVPLDDWVLYVTESPVAYAARALIQGAMYTRDGARIVSVAQEGLLRA